MGARGFPKIRLPSARASPAFRVISSPQCQKKNDTHKNQDHKDVSADPEHFDALFSSLDRLDKPNIQHGVFSAAIAEIIGIAWFGDGEVLGDDAGRGGLRQTVVFGRGLVGIVSGPCERGNPLSDGGGFFVHAGGRGRVSKMERQCREFALGHESDIAKDHLVLGIFVGRGAFGGEGDVGGGFVGIVVFGVLLWGVGLWSVLDAGGFACEVVFFVLCVVVFVLKEARENGG